ncbi:MAG TPA: hypothetical protein DHW61_17665 [Lachnoclostridium phytofermentans]|uniref:ATP-dependent Clp protease proteolytic subunit n=1 Tax=Lachnoclostridium phytofermentans TaxID=66219 RepID=A0A3D2XCH4_9FIRM|nr:hypothetical protein [Lachnoclostridium phytofermentans]
MRVNHVSAGLVIAQLLYLEAEDSKKDIRLYINSPGGSTSTIWRDTSLSCALAIKKPLMHSSFLKCL